MIIDAKYDLDSIVCFAHRVGMFVDSETLVGLFVGRVKAVKVGRVFTHQESTKPLVEYTISLGDGSIVELPEVEVLCELNRWSDPSHPMEVVAERNGIETPRGKRAREEAEALAKLDAEAAEKEETDVPE